MASDGKGQRAVVADLMADALERSERYLDTAMTRSVAATLAARSALGGFDEPLEVGGRPAAETVEMLDELGSPGTVISNGPRYFGFVTGGSQPVAAAASLLATAWDQNGALPIMSPTVAAIDAVTVRWILGLLGLPSTATATFCGGASEANLIGMITARDEVLRRAGWDVPADGLIGAPMVTVITSEETHASMKKAVALAGLGRDRMMLVPTDDQGRMVATALPAIEGPAIVVLQAGNVNTGHSDPFREVIAAAHDAGAWVHVDGAFGLWAAAAPERARLVEGMEAADSWATDAHKWLNVPYDNALAIVADGDALGRSMRVDGAYLPSTSERSPMQLGLQMSQRARAIPVWAVLRTLGRQGVSDLIERNCSLASRFAQRLAEGGAEVLHDVCLNQVLVAFGDDETTSAVIDAVQADGTCWAGGTEWNGRRAMRISVSGHETTEADVDRSAAVMLGCWESLPG